jgi:sulfopyruvate decarboxylase alpha subunit
MHQTDNNHAGSDDHQAPDNHSRSGFLPRWAAGVSDGLWDGGCREVVYVPDNPLSHILAAFERDHPVVRATLATREEEAVGIAAGLYLGGAKPALLMQSSGLGNTLNAVGSLLIAFQIPVVMVVSMRGDPGEWNAAQVPMGRAVRRVLDALGVSHLSVNREDEASDVAVSLTRLAFGTRLPVACLLPRRLTVPAGGGRS